jgi:hypothetical protein
VLEGHGVVPDIEVGLDREMLLKGIDSQLDSAIRYIEKDNFTSHCSFLLQSRSFQQAYWEIIADNQEKEITITQRTKETGIRKVLGASAGEVMRLQAKPFLRWILAANLAA